ncbi:lysozyme C [Procambarus clarkii]|uniref:lysozyme C n=1 Tax=Procambarus clarkii TaxID=6728 RepID=UPI001E678305|nr:lysozyme C-like [Procambarus clarkii]
MCRSRWSEMRQLAWLWVLVVEVMVEMTSGKVFEKCELATVLEKTHNMTRGEVKKWVCIAQYESTFNTTAVNHGNWDGSKDYGLFQLSNKFWCDDARKGKNVCRIPCTDLLDDDLTDDLACIKKIIRDTEQWKGKGTAFTAWVAYVSKCQNRDLDEYMSECWSGSSSSSNTVNIRDESILQPDSIIENQEAAKDNFPIVNLVRVPIRHVPYVAFPPVLYYIYPPLSFPTPLAIWQPL